MFVVMSVAMIAALVGMSDSAPSGCSCGKPLNYMAVNIQIFGQSKIKKEDAMEEIVKFMGPEDVVLVQEVRDKTAEKSEQAVEILKNRLNSDSKFCPSGDCWDYTISERLGRSSSKEQYAYYYRKCRVTVAGAYGFKDVQDAFQREPYIVHFQDKCSGAAVKDFGVIGIHTEPKKAHHEIIELRKQVFVDAQKHFSHVKNWILNGDFNMDCSYVSNTKEKVLINDVYKGFKFLVPDEWDTTTSNSNCAYDRFVVIGDEIEKAANQVEIDRFDLADGLTQKQAKRVSDHYPITMKIGH